MKLREELNNYAGKIPVVGDALTTPISRKGLAGLVAGTAMALALEADAVSGRIETMYGKHDVKGPMISVDAMVAGPINAQMKYFFRHRDESTVGEGDNKTTSFTLAKVRTALSDHFDLDTGVKLVGGQPAQPRIGLWYHAGDKDAMLNAFATRSFTENPDTDYFARVEGRPDINDRFAGYYMVEGMTNVSDGGTINQSVARARLGIKDKTTRITAGGAADVYNLGTGNDAVWTLGGFVSVDIGGAKAPMNKYKNNPFKEVRNKGYKGK